MSRWEQVRQAVEIANDTGVLDLSDLRLTEIPPQVLLMKHLVSLNLSLNSLESLPVEIAQLTNLATLSVSNNLLKTLPWTLGSLPSLTCLEVNGNPLEGDFSGLLQPNSGVTAMKLYRSTFFSVTSMFPDSLMVLDGPSNPEFIIDKMSGPRKVGCTPFEITIEFDVPSYDTEYKNIGGFAIYMVADDGSRSHKPFKAVDMQGVSGIVHVGTVRPSEEFTYRSPCQASHPKSRQFTITNLQPGERYCFACVALCCNTMGKDSEISDFVEMSTMPTQVPDPPVCPEVTAFSWEAASLTWGAPDDHCFPISEYLIYCCEAGTNSMCIVGRTTLLQHQVIDLEADTLYHFAVAAVNCAGTSTPASVTVSTQPSLCTVKPVPAVVDEISFFYAVVSWEYPAMRGADITGMEVQMQSGGSWVNIGTLPPSKSQIMQGDLEPGTTYQFRLRTHSFAGPSSWSDTTTVCTRTAEMPGKAYPPRVVPNLVALTSVTLQWGPDLMSDFDGPPVREWELQMQDQTHLKWQTVGGENFTATRQFSPQGKPTNHFHRSSAVEACQYVKDSLTPGSEYRFRIRALNDAGFGEWSEPTTTVTLSQVPAKPADLIVVSDSMTEAALTLRMTEPATFGADVLGYCVQRRTTRPWFKADINTGEISDVSAWYSVGEFPPNVLEFTITEDLDAGTSQVYRYCARSNLGESEWSESLNIMLPPALAPDAPVITVCQVNEDAPGITVAWSVPPTHGAMVNGYELWSLCAEAPAWQLIYTGIHSTFEDTSYTTGKPPQYRARAITDETPMSPFSECVQAVPLATYDDKIPIVIKGPWGPQHEQLIWVPRNESIKNLRYKVPPNFYPGGKIPGFDEESQVRFVHNGHVVAEDETPKPYYLVISDETGGTSHISGHDIVMSRDLSFARIYNRLLRHTNKALRTKQESTRVCDDRTGKMTIYNSSQEWPESNGPFLELGGARVTFRKCARVPEGPTSHPLRPRGPHFPIFDVSSTPDDTDPTPSLLPDGFSKGSALIPMYQKEALWMDFNVKEPVALKCVCNAGTPQEYNVLTGQRDVPLLMKIKKSHIWPPNAQQNYMILPQQRWLADRNIGEGRMAQFCATRLDDGNAAEAQMSGAAQNSIQISAFPLLKDDADVYFTPKLNTPPVDLFCTPEDAGLRSGDVVYLRSKSLPGGRSATLADHGIGAHAVLTLEFVPGAGPAPAPPNPPSNSVMEGFSCGGRITDKIYPDLVYGPEKWDVDVEAKSTVHMVNSRVFVSCTGRPMPETSITEKNYKKIGMPKAFLPSWNEEPDSNGLLSNEVSEITSERQGMFQSRSCLISYELRK